MQRFLAVAADSIAFEEMRELLHAVGVQPVERCCGLVGRDIALNRGDKLL
jgi:hypothetical protein